MASVSRLPRLFLLLNMTIDPTDSPVRICSKVHTSNIASVFMPHSGSSMLFVLMLLMLIRRQPLPLPAL